MAFVYINGPQKNRQMLERSSDIVLNIFSRILKSVRRTYTFELKDLTAWTLGVSLKEINIIKIFFSIYYKYLLGCSISKYNENASFKYQGY